MKVEKKGFIADCTKRTKESVTKDGEVKEFTYYLVQVVGMGFDETFFSMNPVEVSEKEVKFELDIKNGKVNFVGIK